MGSGGIEKQIVWRLKDVARQAQRAMDRMPSGDPEALHDIRVGIRTADSLLRPFLQLGNFRPVKRVLGHLKQWSSAQGSVRDTEAQLALLQALMPPPYSPELDAWLKGQMGRVAQQYIAIQRRPHAKQLWQHYRELQQKSSRCLAKHGRSTLRYALAVQLVDLLTGLYDDCTRGKALFNRECDWHRTRLLAKRTRYLMESFPESYTDMVVIHELVKSVQTTLGRLRDWISLRQRMPAYILLPNESLRIEAIQAQLLEQAITSLATLGMHIPQAISQLAVHEIGLKQH